MSLLPAVLGVDAGTTSMRCIAWDLQGQALAQGRAEISLHSAEQGGFEQDPADWWRAFCLACQRCTAQLTQHQAQALCIAQQRETFVLCKQNGEALHPAVLWMDERAWRQVDDARRGPLAAELHQLTGKPICITPSLYKIQWLAQRRPDLWQQRPMVVDVHAWLVHRLTGHWRSSTACADPMGLVDMNTGQWSQPVLEMAQICPSQLPDLYSPGEQIGRVTRAAAQASGLPLGLPVVAGAGDGQAAALGASLTGPQEAYLNLGTALVSGLVSPTYRVDPAFRTLFGAQPGTWLLETDLKGGTFTLNWLVERLVQPGASAQEKNRRLAQLEAEARQLPPGAEGLVLLPYWCGVMNPYWEDDASGLVLGWRERHGHAHLYRAILEGLALEQRLHSDGVQAATGVSLKRLVLMGGGSRSDLWCQILADATGRVIQRAGHPETTALGAGLLAATGVGLHRDVLEAVQQMTSRGDIFSPGEHTGFYGELFQIYRGLFPVLRGSMRQLAELTRSIH